MAYVPGKTYLEAQPWGRGWIVFWACFGHRRPRVLFGPDKRAKQFPTREDAMSAGLAMIQAREPDIVSTIAAPADDEVAERLAAEVLAFKDKRDREQREMRKIFRPGKSTIAVETIRSRRA